MILWSRGQLAWHFPSIRPATNESPQNTVLLTLILLEFIYHARPTYYTRSVSAFVHEVVFGYSKQWERTCFTM